MADSSTFNPTWFQSPFLSRARELGFMDDTAFMTIPKHSYEADIVDVFRRINMLASKDDNRFHDFLRQYNDKAQPRGPPPPEPLPGRRYFAKLMEDEVRRFATKLLVELVGTQRMQEVEAVQTCVLKYSDQLQRIFAQYSRFGVGVAVAVTASQSGNGDGPSKHEELYRLRSSEFLEFLADIKVPPKALTTTAIRLILVAVTYRPRTLPEPIITPRSNAQGGNQNMGRPGYRVTGLPDTDGITMGMAEWLGSLVLVAELLFKKMHGSTRDRFNHLMEKHVLQHAQMADVYGVKTMIATPSVMEVLKKYQDLLSKFFDQYGEHDPKQVDLSPPKSAAARLNTAATTMSTATAGTANPVKTAPTQPSATHITLLQLVKFLGDASALDHSLTSHMVRLSYLQTQGTARSVVIMAADESAILAPPEYLEALVRCSLYKFEYLIPVNSDHLHEHLVADLFERFCTVLRRYSEQLIAHAAAHAALLSLEPSPNAKSGRKKSQSPKKSRSKSPKK